MAWYAYCLTEVQTLNNGARSRRPFLLEGIQGVNGAPVFGYPSGDFSVVVSESGASVYSASDVARQEFPDLDLTVRGAHDRGKWVGVCGGMAGDAQAVPILIGLGVDELSVGVPSVAAVKAQVRRLSFEACRELAARALDAETEMDVRAMTPAVED